MERFNSKRNEVYLSGGGEGRTVRKRVLHGDAADEAAVLAALQAKGVAVPRVMSVCGGELVTEYIGGRPLPDALEDAETWLPSEKAAYSEGLSDALCGWFDRFYSAVDALWSGALRRGDCNGRNFIIGQTCTVIGVDFEELPAGDRLLDFCELSAFILLYDPPSHLKRDLADRVLSKGAALLGRRQTEAAALRDRVVIEINVRRRAERPGR